MLPQARNYQAPDYQARPTHAPPGTAMIGQLPPPTNGQACGPRFKAATERTLSDRTTKKGLVPVLRPSGKALHFMIRSGRQTL